MENHFLEEHKRICEEIDALGDYSNSKYSSKEYEKIKLQADNLERQRKDKQKARVEKDNYMIGKFLKI